jgi:hypothetical protein
MEVHFRERLQEKNGVTKSGAHVTEIVTEGGDRWQAGIFADRSYEGDLMAKMDQATRRFRPIISA